jgi:hypothetical protein
MFVNQAFMGTRLSVLKTLKPTNTDGGYIGRENELYEEDCGLYTDRS